MTAITTDIPALALENDNRHQLDKNELARESLAYMIQIPEEGIGGFLYTWVNGTSKAGAAVCLFGPGIGEEPIFEICDGIDVPFDMDFFNWQVGGLKLQLKALLHTASVTYESDTVSVEYHFEGLHPAYAYSTSKDGCPQWIANDRFEQQGNAKGFIKLAHKTVHFDGHAQRDHSWGTRDWGVNQHWKWVHAQAGPDLGVHFWQLFSLGKGTLNGYVYKEGKMAQVVDVDVEFSCKESLKPQALKATVTDSLGRTTELSAANYAEFPFQVHELITLYECPLKLSIDGEQGQGWLEMMWPNDLIGYMKDRTID
jgi:hypothetical protein